MTLKISFNDITVVNCAAQETNNVPEKEPESTPKAQRNNTQPDQSVIQTWHELNLGGKSFEQIGKMPEANGYKRATIHRYVQAFRKSKETKPTEPNS